jgi:hypothetical protein
MATTATAIKAQAEMAIAKATRCRRERFVPWSSRRRACMWDSLLVIDPRIRERNVPGLAGEVMKEPRSWA